MESELKILVIGPPKSGKSKIANYLSGGSETTYKPCAGVRVLTTKKFIAPSSPSPTGVRILTTKKSVTPSSPSPEAKEYTTIEIWDISCEKKFEGVWPTAREGCDGVVLVLNGDKEFDENLFLELILNFPKEMRLPPSLCVGLLHHSKWRNRSRQAPKFLQVWP